MELKNLNFGIGFNDATENVFFIKTDQSSIPIPIRFNFLLLNNSNFLLLNGSNFLLLA